MRFMAVFAAAGILWAQTTDTLEHGRALYRSNCAFTFKMRSPLRGGDMTGTEAVTLLVERFPILKQRVDDPQDLFEAPHVTYGLLATEAVETLRIIIYSEPRADSLMN